MTVKKVFLKLYPKIFFFSFIFFLSTSSLAISAVLTEEEIKYIESQSKDGNDDDESYIDYQDVEKKTKKTPFNFFGLSKKKTKKKIEKKTPFIKEEKDPGKLKIGVLLPITGQYSYIGQSLLDTMQLVVYENKNIDSELIIKDTKANPSLAKKATNELVKQNVDVILGPFFSTSLNKSLKIAKYKNIPLISFSNDKSQKEEGVYLMGFEPEKQIAIVTDHAIKKKYKRFAALLPNSKYGKRVLNAYRKTLSKNQLLLTKVELYNPEKNDIEKNIQNLVGLEKNPKIEIDEETGENPLEDFDPGFDVLLLAENGNKLRETSALLTYYGVDFKKVGNLFFVNVGILILI